MLSALLNRKSILLSLFIVTFFLGMYPVEAEGGRRAFARRAARRGFVRRPNVSRGVVRRPVNNQFLRVANNNNNVDLFNLDQNLGAFGSVRLGNGLTTVGGFNNIAVDRFGRVFEVNALASTGAVIVPTQQLLVFGNQVIGGAVQDVSLNTLNQIQVLNAIGGIGSIRTFR